jgi:hypothetical protein
LNAGVRMASCAQVTLRYTNDTCFLLHLANYRMRRRLANLHRAPWKIPAKVALSTLATDHEDLAVLYHEANDDETVGLLIGGIVMAHDNSSRRLSRTGG